MKSLVKIGIFFFLTCKLFALDVDIQSEVALLVNMETGQVLFEKNADEKVCPASTTKIATMLYALKEVKEDLDVEIKADQDCIGSITEEMQKTLNYNYPPYWQVIGGTHMEIHRGDVNTLENLLYGMMLVSANDGANVVAKYVSGTIPAFVAELNEFVKDLGCQHTHFRNPHGYHFPKHETTARDLCILTRAAWNEEVFRKIVSSPSYGKFKNLNQLLHKNSRYYYPYAIGIKTGRNHQAGFPLISAAEKNGRQLLLILMKVPSEEARYRDSIKLFEAAFSEEKQTEVILKQGLQPFKYKIDGVKKTLKTDLKDEITLSFYPSEKPKLKASIHWRVPALPLRKGDSVADLILEDEKGKVWAQRELLAHDKITGYGLLFYLKRFALFLTLFLLLVFLWRKLFKVQTQS